MKRVVAVLMVIGLMGSAQALDVFNYDFNNLTLGNIAGQDGWTATMSANVIDRGGGDLALNPTTGTNYIGRVNSFVLTEEMDAFQADFRYYTAISNTTCRLYLTGGGKTTPWLGFNGGKFEVRTVKTNGTSADVAITVDVPATFNSGDWVTLRMTFDVVNKTGAAFYKNLTDGETAFTQISVGGDLGLSSVSDMSAYLKSFTGLSIRTDQGNSVRAIDNIAVTVPEPATMALLGLGSLVLVRRKK